MFPAVEVVEKRERPFLGFGAVLDTEAVGVQAREGRFWCCDVDSTVNLWSLSVIVVRELLER